MHTPTLIIKTPIDELESEIVTLHAHLCAEEYQFLVKLREFDLRQGWRSYHFNHCAEWLNMKCGISLSTGREKLRVAKALFFLPQISGAYQNGELSYSKVRAMTRVASDTTEQELLGYARKATASQVDQHCAGLRNVQRKFSTPSANRAHDQRKFRVTPTLDGSFLLNGELPEESARLVLKALELCMARALREQDPSEEDLEELENPSAEGMPVWDSEDPAAQRAAAVKRDQQNADALVDLSREYLAGGTGRKTSTADHYQVLVHVDEAALRGQPNTDSKSDLPIETVRRLCCDGSVIAVTESKASSAVKVRVPAEAQARANASRDAFEVSPGTPADDVAACSSTDPQNSTLTDSAYDPSRDASAVSPATSADDAPTGSTVDSQDSSLTDFLDNPSRDALAIPSAIAPNGAAGRSRPSLNLSRKHRLVQPALRRALEARDRGCRFPGCSHERWLDAHHVVHWADGGETSLENTLLLCSSHHRLLHEGGFAIRADANGEWQFQNAKGMRQIPAGR